jgi:catechol 2,3-dioxygenase-like lactoylglutathione lyase family enzyme
MSVGGTAVVWLPVTDLDRAVSFYRDTLGLREGQQADGWAQLESDGVRIGLNAGESPTGSGGAVIAFRAEPGIEEAVEDLRGKDVHIAGEISDHPWGRVATFRDPDGNDLQLYQPPDS